MPAASPDIPGEDALWHEREHDLRSATLPVGSALLYHVFVPRQREAGTGRFDRGNQRGGRIGCQTLRGMHRRRGACEALKVHLVPPHTVVGPGKAVNSGGRCNMSQGWRSHGAKTWRAFDGGAASGAVAPLATRGIAECHRPRVGPDSQDGALRRSRGGRHSPDTPAPCAPGPKALFK